MRFGKAFAWLAPGRTMGHTKNITLSSPSSSFLATQGHRRLLQRAYMYNIIIAQTAIKTVYQIRNQDYYKQNKLEAARVAR